MEQAARQPADCELTGRLYCELPGDQSTQDKLLMTPGSGDIGREGLLGVTSFKCARGKSALGGGAGPSTVSQCAQPLN